MQVFRRTIAAGAGPGVAGTALALTLLLGSATEGLAQTPVSNCTFSADQIEGLKEAIADAVGLNNTNSVTTPIVIVPSFNDNLGQQTSQGGGPNVEFSGIVICTSEDEASPLQSVSEADDFPSTGTADVLEVQQSSYVLIEDNVTRRLRLCHTDLDNRCFVTSEP